MFSQFASLFDRMFENKMEGFETAIPCVIKSVNNDGSVDVTPCIKNVLSNMQYEPTSNGELNVIPSVPILWNGTENGIVKYELSKGDSLLCISCSRDLKNWIFSGYGEGPYNPDSFSGNDLNSLIALPIRPAGNSGSTSVILEIKKDGKIAITANEMTLTGDLNVEGNVRAGNDVIANKNAMGVSLKMHIHNSAVGPTAPSTATIPPQPQI